MLKVVEVEERGDVQVQSSVERTSGNDIRRLHLDVLRCPIALRTTLTGHEVYAIVFEYLQLDMLP
jgi:hypothetical protein